MIEELTKNAATSMVAKLENEMMVALNQCLPGWSMVDVKHRCKMVKTAGIAYETFYFDDKPLLNIYPIEVEHVREADRIVIRLTQKIRPLLVEDTES